jgi:hypothetical protein
MEEFANGDFGQMKCLFVFPPFVECVLFNYMIIIIICVCVFNSTKFSFISSLHDKPVIEMVVQKSIVDIALSYKVLQNKSVWLYKAWVKFYFYEYVRNHDPHVQACILGALALTLIRWYAPSSNSFSSQVGGVLLEHC